MRKKILIVDDSQTVVLMERMILSNGPYELLVAKDGQEGVEMAIANKPDLILLDLVMPRMTGFEALRELRANDETCRTPVIVVTTRGEEQNIETAYQSGCNDYVTKPIDKQELMAKVKSQLGA